LKPRIRPEVVSCTDVHYEALCDGATVGVRGVAKNFLGAATDCFMGDTAQIDPTPSCPVERVHVAVRDVRTCQSP